MWILNFLPDSFLIFVTHAITSLGALGIIIGFTLGMIPLIKQYSSTIKIVSTIILLAGIYLEGGLSTELEWRKRVAEMEEKVKIVEKKVVVTNTKIKDKIVVVNRLIEKKGKDNVQYIDREVVKYDSTCVIPKEFVKAVNDAATKVEGGANE
jgi:hypothetical protein